MRRDAERLERYVHSVFLRFRREKWPTMREASKALRWTMAHVEEVVEDSELLDTTSESGITRRRTEVPSDGTRIEGERQR